MKTATKQNKSRKQMKEARKLAQESCVPSIATTPEEAEVLAAAQALGDSFTRVTLTSGVLIAEATEMMTAASDGPELERRGYVSAVKSFAQVQLLTRLLTTAEVNQADFEKGARRSAEAEAQRTRLKEIRRRLASIADAAGVLEVDFSVDSRRVDELNNDMKRLVQAVEAKRALMPDQPTVDALLSEAKSLIAAEATNRISAKNMVKARTRSTRSVEQLKRLLFDQLRRLSKQGLAAYPDEPTREIAYRLERFTTKRTKKQPLTPENPVVPELKAPATKVAA